MARDFDALVVGAGVGGAVLAALLVRSRLCQPERVALLADRLPAPPAAQADWDLRVFALSRASERVLQLAGVWPLLPTARRTSYEAMCVWDAGGTPRDAHSLRFDAAGLGEPNLGHIVDGAQLHWHACEAARAAGVIFLQASLETLRAHDDAVTLQLDDGRTLRTGLLVGADGAHSRVRQLAGIETAGHAYDQEALVAHIATGQPHERTAWQRFLPGGPLALLPLGDGRSSMVWSVPRTQVPALRALSPDAFGEALTRASDAVLGPCRLTSPLTAFALNLQYALRYIATRTVLIGDAAHVVHPLAGQGLNLGLLDCATLVEILREADGMGACGDLRALRRYERWRRSENLLAVAGLDALQSLFSGDQPLLGSLRRAGLRVVAALPPLKDRLARQALGLAGDIPAFLRSENPL